MDEKTLKDIVKNLISHQTTYNKDGKSSLIPEDQFCTIIDEVEKLIKEEPTLIQLQGDWIVIGDVHGNFEDLLRIFEANKYPPEKNYLFLGDYVDRGRQSIEILIMLFSLKLLFPQNIYLLHGNHEGEYLTTLFNFKSDCYVNGFKKVYTKCISLFRYLSLAAIINGKFLCLHGCTSPDLKSITQIEEIKKPIDDTEKLTEDILWSDPGSPESKEYLRNDRGAGWYTPGCELKKFLAKQSLKLLIRSHEYQPNGFSFNFGDKGGCLTVFSTSDYCGIQNMGAIALITKENTISLVVHHPLTAESRQKIKFTLPAWSIPQHSPHMVEISQ